MNPRKRRLRQRVHVELEGCRAYQCDMLENVQEEAVMENGDMLLDFRAFEVKTVKT